ncbi:MAG: YdjY domain-containing protein [Clostridia bacterium]|nr:YdjY domain-containing protein [Clostridia bacterium]
MFKGLRTLLAVLVVLGLVTVAGCGAKETPTSTKENTTQTMEVAGVSKESPIKVNKEEGTVTFLGAINAKYLYETTRHGIVFEGGSNGDKAIFKAFATPEAFYNAVKEIGGNPGNNMTGKNKEQTQVQGDILDVVVTWEGADKEYSLNELIIDSNNKPLKMRFGGNLETALNVKTGCLFCLDSCPAGIASNSNYTYGAVETRKEVKYSGNKDVLPSDGTPLAFKVKVKK